MASAQKTAKDIGGKTNAKERILDAAVRLFNEKGTKAVSTNHIAAAAGISPGHLYYHFRNKEHIIRAILKQLDARGMEQYRQIQERHELGTARAFVMSIDLIQRITWEYRFFKRELTALLLNDPELKRMVLSAPAPMETLARLFIDAAVGRGVLKNISEEERSFLADGFCMTNLFWVNYLEMWGKEVNDESLSRGSAHFISTLKPYLTDKGFAEIAKLKASG